MRESLSDLRRVGVASALRGCQLFTGLPPADLDAVTDLATTRLLRRGEYLFHEGDPSAGFYIVQKGAVNVHRVNASGKEQVIHVFRPGESFAEASLATGQGYPADARAIEDSQVILVQREGFLGLLRRHPELALRMLASMSVHLRVIIGQLEDLTLKDVETRLANWLAKRCPDPESTRPHAIELPTSKRVLAAELGTVSETLSRTLARLREQGLLSVKGRVIHVPNPAALAAILRRNLGG